MSKLAFPNPESLYCDHPGMTQRMWLTGMALCGILSNSGHDTLAPDEASSDAVAMADAAIERLEA